MRSQGGAKWDQTEDRPSDREHTDIEQPAQSLKPR